MPTAHHGAALHGIGADADLLAFLLLGLVGSAAFAPDLAGSLRSILMRQAAEELLPKH